MQPTGTILKMKSPFTSYSKHFDCMATIYIVYNAVISPFFFFFNLAYNTVMDCLHLFFSFSHFSLSTIYSHQKMCVFVCRYKISFKYSIALLTVQIIQGIIHNYVLINDKLKDTLITMLNIQ